MKICNSVWLLSFLFLINCSCNSKNSAVLNNKSNSIKSDQMILNKEKFDDKIDNKEVKLFTVRNNRGMKVSITNYGGRIVSAMVPDKSGHYTDVVVGFGSVKDYVKSTEPYFGATIGRFGNRIANGKFTLDGHQYSLFKNNGPNTLHGGKKGFQAVVWDAVQNSDSSLSLSYICPDGEEGFPGNLSVEVDFTITNENEIRIIYKASTDKRTVINLTNHSFFNLNGEGSGTILNHKLKINAQIFTPVDSTLIPTGKIESVLNTPFDFSNFHNIGERISMNDPQLKYGKGYDHNFVLNEDHQHLNHAATVIGDLSGIQMDIYTTEPALQFYSGNFMKGMNTFKSGAKDEFRTAFCLETQHYPDSPNQPGFPSTVLDPGKIYSSETVYKFTLVK